MAAGKLVIVTGFKELDAKLRTMEPKLQRKFIRGALRKGGKRLQQEAKRIIRTEAKDTGALEKSVGAPKALKRSRKRIGVSVMPDRDKLFANYRAKHGGKAPSPMAGHNDPHYYAASIEFGTETQEAVRPFRRALYDNAKVYQEYFKADLREFIATQKVDTKLPKVSKK